MNGGETSLANGTASAGKPLIVHLSADYPDAVVPGKTQAIARLVAGTSDSFDHRVYSLNRTGAVWAMIGAGEVSEIANDGTLASWTYRAPPGGLALKRAMGGVARAIVQDLAAKGLKPALIHGHKLSFEGIAARQVAQELSLPYALTLQGNTDQKVVGARPDLGTTYRQVWRDAEAVFSFTPWISDWCSARLGPRPSPPIALPCITNAQQIIAPKADVPPRIVSAFGLDEWKNKNVGLLIDAMVELRRTIPDAELEIAGSGSVDSMTIIETLIGQAQAGDFVKLVGRIEPDEIQQWLNGAAAFAMLSLRETFGMVYLEALLSGCPILHSRGNAVDGYFPDQPFALSANMADAHDIAAKLATLLQDRAPAVAALEKWQEGDAERFLAPAILETCRNGWERAITGAAGEN